MTHEAGIDAATILTHEQAMDIACGVMFNGMYDKTLGPALEDAIQAYLSASGMVLVPREPTKEMCYVGQPTYDDLVSAYEIWGLMVDSAPDPFRSKP